MSIESVSKESSIKKTSIAPSKRWMMPCLAGALFFFMLYAPFLPHGPARSAIAVFCSAAFLWATGAFPLAVTGILVLALLPLSGAMPAAKTYQFFGSDAVFFILSAFILASPVIRSGLSTRVALLTLKRFGTSPLRLQIAVLLLGGIASFFMSEHAVAAMIFPIVLEIVYAANAKAGSRFAIGMFLALAWGCIIGGTATLLGGARGPLALGILQSTTGQSISFLYWTMLAVPLSPILFAVAAFILNFIGKDEAVSLDAARHFLKKRTEALGVFSKREKMTMFVALATVFCWAFFGDRWGMGTIGLLGVTAAFFLGIARWQEVEEDVNWGLFLMYGSSIALSSALRESGAANIVATALFSGIQDPVIFLGLAVIVTLLMTEIMSNAAAVGVVLPMALPIAEVLGIDLRAVTLAVAVASGLGFLFPMSTPAIAIAVSTGHVSTAHTFRYGVYLEVVGLLVIIALILWWWPLLGVGG